MAIKRPYGVTPFWFWNDDLEKSEVIRQIAAMDAAGVGGFVIHQRVGLPRSLGWMSEGLLAFMRLACAEAAKRGLRVILYDEGMYPSGSSSGQVVAENSDFACRGLELRPGKLREQELGQDETFACHAKDSTGQEHTVVDRALGSHIRGLHYIDETEETEDEPPAADLLNPEAMKCFLRLVHGRYAQELGEWFGSTITGIFTDEPSLLGRGAPREVIPGTTGILDEVRRITGEDFSRQMCAVFLDSEPGHREAKAKWNKAVRRRLEETYYSPMRQWCEDHGLELMGHPESPDDLALLRWFNVPGQDLVWRWVLPGPAATQGPQSVQAKVASSAAWLQGAPRNSNELFGAYGHELTLQEMQWLAGWALVRGQNWLIPHAYYYSVRGSRRDERPPDVGLNSPWGDQLREINSEWEALCQAVSESQPVISACVLAKGDEAPWRCAEALLQRQVDFHYLDLDDLDPSLLSPDGRTLTVKDTAFTALAVEDGWLDELPDWLKEAPLVVSSDQEGWQDRLLALAKPSVRLRDVEPHLRARLMTHHGRELVLLFNEGVVRVEGEVTSPAWLADQQTGSALSLGPGEIRLIRQDLPALFGELEKGD